MTRTALARLALELFALAGRIKTPHRVYRMTTYGTVRPNGWRWLPCGLSMWFLRASMRLDNAHWDHWALVHEHCNATACPDCGGGICGEVDLPDSLDRLVIDPPDRP